MRGIQLLVCCLTASLLSVNCQTPCDDPGAVQLVGLQTGAGRVELCQDEFWGTVCSDTLQWGLKNAQVVCQSLNYQYAVTAIPQDRTFQLQAGPLVPIHLTDVQCNGTEPNISSCTHSTEISRCSHFNDVVIVCGVNTATAGDVRLVGDTSDYRGAVEYFDPRVGWTGVCADADHASTWNNRAAEVVCAQLGFERGRAFSQSAEFMDQLLVADFVCDDSAISLEDCDKSSLLFNGGCDTKDAGWIECQPTQQEDYSVRLLPGSRDGIVEVAINGRWGQVCGDQFWSSLTASPANAEIVCDQLGLQSESVPTVLTGNNYIRYRSNIKPFWLSGVLCSTETDSTLEECTQDDLLGYSVGCSSSTSVSVYESAELTCGPPIPYRLSGGAVAGIVISVLLVVGVSLFLFIKGPELWKKRHSYSWYRKLTTPSRWCRELTGWFCGCCGSLKGWCQSHTPRRRERTTRRPHPAPTTTELTAETTTEAVSSETREYPPPTFPRQSSTSPSSPTSPASGGGGESAPTRVEEPVIGFRIQGGEEQNAEGGQLTEVAPPPYQAAVSYPVASGPSQPPAYTEKVQLPEKQGLPYPAAVSDAAYPPAAAMGAGLPYPTSGDDIINNSAYPPTAPGPSNS